MGRPNKSIGGEYWYSDDILNDTMDNFYAVKGKYLDGGVSAIKYILNNIKFNNNEYILVPSYACPTIVDAMREENLNIIFYEVTSELKIELKDIISKLKSYNVKALYFINYFGFYHNEETKRFLQDLKQKDIVIIEDAVQMLWFNKSIQFIGTYIFNSYRKFLPYDGSLLLGKIEDENIAYRDKKYYKLIEEARKTKTNYINSNEGNESDYLNKFEEAHKSYYKKSEIGQMPTNSKVSLNRIDVEKLRNRICNNYRGMYERIKDLSDVKILFQPSQISDNIPLTFPILVHNRDCIRAKLREKNIYAPVHWQLKSENWIDQFSEARKLSNNILSLPIDWRYCEEDLNNIYSSLEEIVNKGMIR